MKKIVIVLLFIVIATTSSTFAAQWQYIYEMPGKVYYIEPSSVFCDNPSREEFVFHAFFLATYNAEGRQEMAKRFLEKYGYIPQSVYELEKSVFLEYFKISNGLKYYCVDEETWYRKDGSVIQEMRYSRSYHQWKKVIPMSHADAICDITFERLVNS